MKYVYNRNRYKLITEASNDSDNVNPEFGETLIGGTLHRLLGFFRAKANESKMNIYSKQLDRLLASMIMVKIKEETNKGETNTTNENDDNFVEEVTKVAAANILLTAGKLAVDGDNEGALEKIEGISDDTLNLLPQSSQEMVTFIKSQGDEENQDEENQDEENQDEESQIDGELGEGEQGEQEDSQTDGEHDELGEGEKTEQEETIKLGDGKTQEEPKKEEPKEEPKDVSDKEKLIERVRKFDGEFNEIKQLYKRCGSKLKNSTRKRVEKIMEVIPDHISHIKDNITKGRLDGMGTAIKQGEAYFHRLREILNNCEPPSNSDVNENLLILESMMYSMLEKNSATQNLTQKQFNRVRRDIEKASKDWEVTKEKLKKINDIAESKQVDVTEITARQGKELAGILNKAKNALIHTKPYDEIRKNQKRWYDKLDSGGRAVNRKGYQTWVKKVTEIVSYYKGQIPDKVITFITDSLDKTNIANDYVTLTQEFLGINTRGKKPSDNSEKLDDHVSGYVIGDTVEYQMTNGKINSGEVLSIGKSDLEIKTGTGTFVILKKRVKSVKKK